MRFCCVGPAPFDDIADICDECEFPQNRARSPEPSSYLSFRPTADKNLNIRTESMIRKSRSTSCSLERCEQKQETKSEAPDKLLNTDGQKTQKNARDGILADDDTDDSGRILSVEWIESPESSVSSEDRRNRRNLGAFGGENAAVLHTENKSSPAVDHNDFGDDCATLQSPSQHCTTTQSENLPLPLKSKNDGLRDLRRSERPYGLPRVA